MQKLQKSFRVIILIGFLSLLLLPEIQKKFNLFEFEPLSGAITPPQKAKFSIEKWFNGEFQKQTETYLNESFGFRNFFIRLHNQIAFSVFKKAKANGVIIGKNNYLYEENYLNAYNGWDFVGESTINANLEKIRFLQDTLQKLNKTLIVVFAAGKGSYYPEFFPNNYRQTPKQSNYNTYVSLCAKKGINYIDFNAYFKQQKHVSKYPLYPKYGIHWSYYGMGVAADSMIKYIEKKRNIHMPHIYWKNITLEDAKDMDYDIGYGMNLLYKITDNQMAYPAYQFEQDSTKTKPRSLFISDSFFWGMFNFGISNVFTENQFWFYNEEVYPDSYTKPLKVRELNLKKAITSKDVIVLLGTEATLPNFGWGAIEKMYNIYSKK